METQTFLVVEATPNPDHAEDLQKYGSQSYALMAKHGGVPVANYKVQSAMDSGDKPAMIGVFSFQTRRPSMNCWSMIPNIKRLCHFVTKASKAFACSFAANR